MMTNQDPTPMIQTLAILSDTHGSNHYIKLTIDKLQKAHVQTLIHLGDNYSDADAFIDTGFEVTRVPGTWGKEYQNPSIDNRCFYPFHDWTLFLSHTPETHYNDLENDLDPTLILREKLCDMFCHGHTHKPSISTHHDTIILNPGHLKEHDNRGYPPTYALLSTSKEGDDQQLRILIKELLTDNTYDEQIVSKTTHNQ